MTTPVSLLTFRVMESGGDPDMEPGSTVYTGDRDLFMTYIVMIRTG